VDATVQTASTERVRSTAKGADARKVVGGAILGAIAGQVIGKSTKGTVVGAAAGAAAGTAAAAATANFDTCLNNGGTVTVTLDGPITVRPAPVN
jgi:outer membrane lipoprotein SlyB